MTTASEEKAREGREEEVSTEPSPRTLRRQVRTCASSVTPGFPPSLEAVTQRVQVARVILARLAAWLDRPGSLAHAQPPTFAQARERHHEHARRWNAPIVRYPRLVWGYVHLIVIKPPLNFAEWVTSSPLWLALACVFVIALLVWS